MFMTFSVYFVFSPGVVEGVLQVPGGHRRRLLRPHHRALHPLPGTPNLGLENVNIYLLTCIVIRFVNFVH